jgi:hypothetical protein
LPSSKPPQPRQQPPRLPDAADVEAAVEAAFDAQHESTLSIEGSVDLKDKGVEIDVEKRF